MVFPQKKASCQRQSPLKGKPLRNPGQSLDEELDRLVGEEGLIWITTIAISLVLTWLEWSRWYFQTEPNPVAAMIVAIPVVGFSIFRLFKIAARAKRLKMARDGEKVVGQYLSDLREKGYRVFHDILGDGFNIDHIIISDRGIFTVETKTYSKPSSGHAEIKFDGQVIHVNGYVPERDLVAQAQAQASWARQVLKDSTGKDYQVKSAIVFPGWFVKSTARHKHNSLWVLNPKALPSFIENEPRRLNPEDMQLATYHLSRYIRTKHYQ